MDGQGGDRRGGDAWQPAGAAERGGPGAARRSRISLDRPGDGGEIEVGGDVQRLLAFQERPLLSWRSR